MESWTVGESVRQTLSLALVLLMMMLLGPEVFGAEGVASQITGMPLGTNVELRLKNQERLRGARGAVSVSGFILVDTRAGERMIAFDDVVSAKRFTAKSHATRNILIGVGIGLAGVAIAAGVLLRCGPLGCK
jgi:hypothetical protein